MLGGVVASALLAVAAVPARAQRRDVGGGHSGSVTVDRGTNLAVTVSPDQRTMVMDLQGVLWRLAGTGGEGRRLTDDFVDPALPRFSPDGRTVVFQSYRDGNYHIRVMRPDGSRQRRMTAGPYDDREPVYSPDGTRIAFSSDRGGSYDIWVLDVATGRLTRWTSAPAQESQPTWSPGGGEIAYITGRAPSTGPRPIGQLVPLTSRTIEASDGSGHLRTLVSEPTGTITSPSCSPDGSGVAYVLATPNRQHAEGVRSAAHCRSRRARIGCAASSPRCSRRMAAMWCSAR